MSEINGQKIVGLLKKAQAKKAQTYTIYENGEFYPPEGCVFSKVTVNVPNSGSGEPLVLKLQERTVTTNGDVLPNAGFDGMNKVTVRVPTYITVPSEDDLPATADEGVIAVISENGITTTDENSIATVNEVQSYLQVKTVKQNGPVTPDDGYHGLSKVTVNVPTYITVSSEDNLSETYADGTIAVISNTKQVYIKESGVWAKKIAYKMQSNEWVEISSNVDIVSYVGSSTKTEVSDALFAELQVVNRDNLSGTITFSTTESGWLWWITPSAISSITVPPFPVPYTEMNSAYVYNGVSYHCYKSDYEIVADTHEFIIA